MAVPSRVYVGITVFGVIASLLTVTYTVLVLTGLRPAPLSPMLSFDRADEPALLLFLVVASLLSVALTVIAWRTLLKGARRDARRRLARQRLVAEQRRYAAQRRRPPGQT